MYTLHVLPQLHIKLVGSLLAVLFQALKKDMLHRVYYHFQQNGYVLTVASTQFLLHVTFTFIYTSFNCQTSAKGQTQGS